MLGKRSVPKIDIPPNFNAGVATFSPPPRNQQVNEVDTSSDGRTVPTNPVGFTVPEARFTVPEELDDESKVKIIKEKLLEYISEQLKPEKFLDDFTLKNLTQEEKETIIAESGKNLREFILKIAKELAVIAAPNLPGSHVFKMMAQIYKELLKQFKESLYNGRIIRDLEKILNNQEEIKLKISGASNSPSSSPSTPGTGGGRKYKLRNKTKRKNKTKRRTKGKKKKTKRRTKSKRKTKRKRN